MAQNARRKKGELMAGAFVIVDVKVQKLVGRDALSRRCGSRQSIREATIAE